MKEVKIYTIVSDQLSPPITGESFCTDMVRHSDYAELEDKYAALAEDNDKAMESLKQADAVVKLAHKKFSALAAENETLKYQEPKLAAMMSCLDAFYADDDVPERAMMTAYNILRKSVGTPATDAFLAEVRASAIPEGYALVPQQIFLEPSDIELICSQCGDGHESGYGDFTDGLLWVGNIQRDDGSIVHGLHISSADYTEEGGVTVCEFAAQPRKGGAV
ncbi:hypothetical protein ACH07K_002489 [Salmonella enterica]|uniref:Ead/Ea22-like family protein n=1 Tax=Salmonella enterica subsp. salamae serovar 48:d:z6 TaxID=1151170 RepID=A0A729JMX9_SALER|nr:hypothetical protein [Salmonella enterica subsp. enterica]EBS2626723.1 hypothetical protein [Salmonella enterica subsp. enterica serovar Anatum]HAC6540111.1 hypothetical protein [Salmonella enterica subsp. salamae serovar 48:d:z6]EBV1421922.1 hypothetical protein [Salmonella enterica subsp. enterica serovar Anatum]EBV7152977.1 hypothetical protein [Salmonella enterica subsp. enterica serovar Anatum]